MASVIDTPLAEMLRFNPKWWWDPIPDYFRDHLTPELGIELGRVQLGGHIKMLETQLETARQTLALMKKG